MHVSGHTATIRSSVTGNMNLIGERYFLYRYHIVIAYSVTGPLGLKTIKKIRLQRHTTPI